MPEEERVKWGEDCISCVTAKEMLMWAQPQSQPYSWGQKCEQEPASSTGLFSIPPHWQWQPAKFSGSGAASLGSRTAKRCWENPSNTTLTISICNKTITTQGHCLVLLQDKWSFSLVKMLSLLSQLKGWRGRLQHWENEEESKIKNHNILLHFHLKISSLSRSCAQQPDVTERWGCSHCLKWTSLWPKSISDAADWLVVSTTFKLYIALCSAWNLPLESQGKLGLTNTKLEEMHLPPWHLLKCH